MPPEPNPTRRARAGSGLARGDRLSALPDCLLHAVLSFLPGPQVVRTCVLSRRWRDLWRTAPCINIDTGEFGITYGSTGSELTQQWSKFEDFTTNLLLFRSAVSLDMFRLNSRVFTGHCLRDVDRWVRRGIKYYPQVLEVLVTVTRGAGFLFPHLGASSCRLKRLHLYGAMLDHHFAGQIQSGCPILEELVLRNCIHNFQEITSHTLKKLIMDDTHNFSKRFVITAPSLEYLQISVSYGYYSNGISLNVTDSLIKAFIYLRCQGEAFSLENQRSLLVDLCNVSDLVVGGFRMKAMLVEELDTLPMYRNMQTLSLDECFYDNCDLNDKLEALGSFLQNAPCLKKVTLQRCMFQNDSETEGHIVRKSIRLPHQCRQTFQCEKLKFVEVIYEDDHDNQLIELLWGIGRILPNATIILTNELVD
ncbi:hypothetical protein EJB05_37741 [Eragrostis curvula]|uniref:F-box domain-containing protein n=1 Tax=Eragrostis curvula TaxID=38414 RepID=A0A5J9TUE4_9POAL|nr:hypothetical protein EJB05_37741 [Eragrostis curvula]